MPDAKAIVRQSIVNYQHDWREGIKWTYKQTDVMRKDGQDVTEVSEIGPLYGTPYERLLSRDGECSPELRQHEDEKFRKAAQERENENEEKRSARIQKYDADRAFFKEIPEGYDFAIVGEPVINGRPTWQIAMTPHPGYIPRNSRSSMFKHIKGTLWIDKEELRWAKAEAEVIDMVSIGWIVARVGPGAKFGLEQVRVRPNFWMQKKIDVDAVAKVMMVHNKDLTEHLTYSDYHLASETETITRNKVSTPAAAKSFK